MLERINKVKSTPKDKNTTNFIKCIMVATVTLRLTLAGCLNDGKNKKTKVTYTETEYMLNSNQYNLVKVELIDATEINGKKYRIKISYGKDIKKTNTEYTNNDTTGNQIIPGDEYICSNNTIGQHKIIKEYRSGDKYIFTGDIYEYEVYHDNNSKPIGSNRNSSLDEIEKGINNTINNFKKKQGIKPTKMENKYEGINKIIVKAKNLPEKLNQYDSKKL